MGRHKDHLSPQLTPFDSSLLPSDSDNCDGHRHLPCWRPGWRNENWAVWECWALRSSCRNPYPPLVWDSGSSSGLLQATEPNCSYSVPLSPAPRQELYSGEPGFLSSHSRACTSHRTPCYGQVPGTIFSPSQAKKSEPTWSLLDQEP